MIGAGGIGLLRRQRGVPIIWSADFTALPLSTSANAATLRAALSAMGLTFTRASSATVQTSASEVVTAGIGVDDPRVGNGGYGQGLVIEEARTNDIAGYYPRASTWGWASWDPVAGSNDQEAAGTAPDGTSNAHRWTATSAGVYGTANTVTAVAATYALSAWGKRASGASSTFGWRVSKDGNTVHPGLMAAGYDGTWKRSSGVYTTTAGSFVVGEDIRAGVGPTTGLCDVYDWGFQLENGKFPTELILTTGATATRAADRLSVTSTRIVQSGRIGIEVTFVPKGLVADMNNPRFFQINGTGADTLYLFSATPGSGELILGGTVRAFAGHPVWAAGDVVQMWIEGGGATAGLVATRINGGAATKSVLAAHAVSASSTGVTSLMAITGGTSVVSSWTQSVRAYAPGRRPAWAS